MIGEKLRWMDKDVVKGASGSDGNVNLRNYKKKKKSYRNRSIKRRLNLRRS